MLKKFYRRVKKQTLPKGYWCQATTRQFAQRVEIVSSVSVLIVRNMHSYMYRVAPDWLIKHKEKLCKSAEAGAGVRRNPRSTKRMPF